MQLLSGTYPRDGPRLGRSRARGPDPHRGESDVLDLDPSAPHGVSLFHPLVRRAQGCEQTFVRLLRQHCQQVEVTAIGGEVPYDVGTMHVQPHQARTQGSRDQQVHRSQDIVHSRLRRLGSRHGATIRSRTATGLWYLR